MNLVLADQSRWKRGIWWFQAFVSCAHIILLSRTCHWDRLAIIWTSGDPRLWLIAVGFTNLSLLAGGLALLVLIRPDGKKFSGPRFLLDYAHVQSLCQVTPGQIGEVMLPFMRGSATVPPGTIAAGLLLQRMVAVLVIAVAAVCFASPWITPGYVIVQFFVVILGCTAITYLIGHDGARARFNAVVGRRYGPILACIAHHAPNGKASTCV